MVHGLTWEIVKVSERTHHVEKGAKFKYGLVHPGHNSLAQKIKMNNLLNAI